MRIWLNDDLEWSRGKRSAHAVHAALHAMGVLYTTPVRVLNTNVRSASTFPIHVWTSVDDDILVTTDDYGIAMTESDTLHAVAEYPDSHGLTVRTVVRRSDSRNDTATYAVRAALGAYRLLETDIVIESSTLHDITCLERHGASVIRDAGRTEIEAGSVTAAVLP